MILTTTGSAVAEQAKTGGYIGIPYSKLDCQAFVEQVLRDTGIADKRIIPVLSQRDDDVFVLRIISSDTFESLTRQKYNMFGDNVSKKSYKNMSW
mgnify:CR=1 FL=1